MASEHSAADAIRASVERLGAIVRHGRWLDSGPNVRTTEGGYLTAIADPGMWPDQQDAITAHIALLASPDVALTLAELLDEIRALDEAWRRTDGHGNAVIRMSAVGDLLERRDALEAAVLGSGT